MAWALGVGGGSGRSRPSLAISAHHLRCEGGTEPAQRRRRPYSRRGGTYGASWHKEDPPPGHLSRWFRRSGAGARETGPPRPADPPLHELRPCGSGEHLPVGDEGHDRAALVEYRRRGPAWPRDGHLRGLPHRAPRGVRGDSSLAPCRLAVAVRLLPADESRRPIRRLPRRWEHNLPDTHDPRRQ